MTGLTISSASYCARQEIVHSLEKGCGYQSVGDDQIVAEASRLSGIAESRIRRAFQAKTSVFNKFNHEKERTVAYLKLATAEILGRGERMIAGCCGQLVPPAIGHILRTCLVACSAFRLARARAQTGLSEADALLRIRQQDADCAAWALRLHSQKNPWNPALYNIVLPVDQIGTDAAVETIQRKLRNPTLVPTVASLQAVEDFRLAAFVEVELAREGHRVVVQSKDGSVVLTIAQKVLMLGRLEEELKSIVIQVPGVRSVTTQLLTLQPQEGCYRRKRPRNAQPNAACRRRAVIR